MIDQCPICKAHQFEKIHHYPAKNPNFFYKEIVDCSTCHSGIALPYKNQDELTAFYDSGAYWEGAPSETLAMHNRNQAKMRVRYLHKYLKNLKRPLDVFDIGAGHGFIGDAFMELGPSRLKNYFFMEPDGKLSSETEKRISKAKRMTSPAKADLVFLNHVLEHTAEPVTSLSYFTKQLNPGSLVYIEVPHRDDYFKQDVFPHSVFFSKNGLEKTIELAGLKCLTMDSFGDKDSTLPSGISLLKKLKIRIYNRLATIFVRTNLLPLAEFFNNLIFDYQNPRTGGMWLRAICQKY